MATELNGSSYYRANPFYQQGNIPDGALKNRKTPLQIGEIPQGQQFFEPTNKKHFQRLGYYSTIAQQNIIHSKEPSLNNLPAKDKQYFRSLNINDIEGATTNTLISKGVKNRLKAKEELQKRALEQRQAEEYEKMSKLSRIEDNRKRMEATSILKKSTEPNYHELVKRMRTEQKEKVMMNPESINQGTNNKEAYQSPNSNLQNRDPIQAYHQQLEKNQKEIQQLELQLSQVKSYKQKAKHDYQESLRQHLAPSKVDPLATITPVTNQNFGDRYHSPQTYQQRQNLSQMHQYPLQENREQYYLNNLEEKLRLSPQELQYLSKQRQRQEREASNYPQYENRSRMKHSEGSNTREMPQMERRNERNSSSLPPPIFGEKGQQHRRFNPTFLSYGSPSIGLVGKNIVGY